MTKHTINLLGTEYVIEDVPKAFKSGYNGKINYVTKTININSNQSIDEQTATFIHEILHFADDYIGTELSEKQVEQLGKVLGTIVSMNRRKLIEYFSIRKEQK